MKKDEVGRKIKAFILSKHFFIALIAFMCALALIALTLVFLRFLGIGEFYIKGETEYKLSELISRSGLRLGDPMYSVNEKQTQKKLLDACPYLKSIKVKKTFPNRIRFEVEERVLGWYIAVGDDYYALDYDMMVLLETYNEALLTDRGLTKLVLPSLESVICGHLPEFGHGDDQLVRETLKIIDIFRTHRFKDRITFLDLTNRFEIKLVLDGAFTVNLGDAIDIETKLMTVNDSIESGKAKGYVGGEINMITPTSCSFRGYFSEDGSSSEQGNKNDATTSTNEAGGQE